MSNNNELGIERGQCSFYRNVRVKENTVMGISEFVNRIKDGEWKNEVTSYRQLMREGRPDEAGRIKSGLPALVVAGVCEGGHTKSNFRKFSGELVIDVDGCSGKAQELLLKLKEQPWVRAGWISVSGDGFKVVVRVDAATPYEFEKLAYPQVAARVQEIIGIPVDKQCKDLTRMCYVSWDGNAFWNDACDVFPWRDNSVTTPVPWEPATPVKPRSIGKSSAPEESDDRISTAKGYLTNFFEKFCSRHVFVKGSRHDFLLKLGASARRNGFSREELKDLIRLAEPHCFAPDYLPGEIERNITDSYYLTEKRMSVEEEDERVKGHHRHYAFSAGGKNEVSTDDADREEEMREQARKMRLEAPCLPDWVFDQLPDILRRGVAVAKNKRQRDMLLLAMMANLSACQPNERMLYDDTYIYPHLFLAVIAPSSTGKGIMAHAARLSTLIQRELDEGNRQRQKEYDEAWMEWEIEHAKAVKEKRKANLELRPEPVVREGLCLVSDVSRTQLIQLMYGSPQGLLLNTTEFDTLCIAMNADYAKFDDLMRACFHHEMFGSDFKSDKRAYIVSCPKLAFCGSGTPSQFYRLCPSLENGSYSRYLIYLAEQDMDFMSMAPRGESSNKSELFKELAGKVLEMYRYLKAYPTDITFSAEQWELHESFFQAFLQRVKMEEVEGPVSVVFRYGLSTARLAMILTGLRKYEAQWSFRDLTCTDEDFRIALAIMEVLLTHSLNFATSLRRYKGAPSEMRKYFKVYRALEKLKQSFSYTELVQALMSEDMSESTARRYRQRLMEMQIIVKQEDTYSFGTRYWRSKLKKLC